MPDESNELAPPVEPGENEPKRRGSWRSWLMMVAGLIVVDRVHSVLGTSQPTTRERSLNQYETLSPGEGYLSPVLTPVQIGPVSETLVGPGEFAEEEELYQQVLAMSESWALAWGYITVSNGVAPPVSADEVDSPWVSQLRGHMEATRTAVSHMDEGVLGRAAPVLSALIRDQLSPGLDLFLAGDIEQARPLLVGFMDGLESWTAPDASFR